MGYIYHFADKEMRNKLSYPIISGYCIKYIEFDWRLSVHKSKSMRSVKLKSEQCSDPKGHDVSVVPHDLDKVTKSG